MGHINHVVAFFCLTSLIASPRSRTSLRDSPGQSFGSWPW